MGKLIVLMGPAGAGKSVQGDLLATSLGGVHLSSGQLLRQDPKTAEKLRDGQLAPAEEVQRLVGEAMAAVPVEQPIVLDGLPRTWSDVQWLEQNLPRLGRELVAVIVLELDLATVMKRLGLRGRADDVPEAIRTRWNLFEAARPVVEHYRDLGLLAVLDGRGTVEEVNKLVRAAVDRAVLA